MVGLVDRRVSKSAMWCRRLALFAIPYFLVSILMHRLGNITTDQVMGLIAFGFILLVISVLLAVRAAVQLWNEGAKGGKAMIVGLFLAIAMLTPFVYAGLTAARLPAINDVATNLYEPPTYSEKTISLRKSLDVPEENDVSLPYDEQVLTQILVAYPKLSPRRYPAGPERVYQAVQALIEDRGWKISNISGLAQKEEQAPKEKQKPGKSKKKKSKGKKSDNNPEVEEGALEPVLVSDIAVDVVSASFIFGFLNDVTILIVSEEENTLVEMRSAARWGIHDFGANASLIENFLHDLDQKLIGIAGEG